MDTERVASSISNFLMQKNVLLISGATLFVLVAGTAWYTSNNSERDAYIVTRGPLEQSVAFSGTITPQNRITLAFERAGTVSSLPFDVGDVVQRGSVVAALDASTANAQREREAAILEAEQAVLEELLSGTRNEEVSVSQAQLSQSEAKLTEATESLVAAMINAFTVADTALERTADPLFNDPASGTPTVKYTTSNRVLEIDLENQRLQLSATFDEWRTDVQRLKEWESHTTTTTNPFASAPLLLRSLLGAAIVATETAPSDGIDVTSYAQLSRSRLIETVSFLQDLSAYTGYLSTTSGLTQAQIDTLIGNVSVDRANLQNALSTLSSKRDAYTSARTAVAVSQEQLALAQAPTRIEDIAAQRAKVRAQLSAVQSADVEIAKHTLRSPVEAVITERYVEQGELLTVGTDVLTLDTAGAFVVEARVSELDVVLLTEGMEAVVTTDAYGPMQKFGATLRHIDPAESVVNGVPGYGVELLLNEDADVLKAGMTANVQIRITLANDTLSIPSGLIEYTSTGAYAHVLRSGIVERIPVTTGVETTSGRVQILSGLSEGDRVVAYDQNRN